MSWRFNVSNASGKHRTLISRSVLEKGKGALCWRLDGVDTLFAEGSLLKTNTGGQNASIMMEPT